MATVGFKGLTIKCELHGSTYDTGDATTESDLITLSQSLMRSNSI